MSKTMVYTDNNGQVLTEEEAKDKVILDVRIEDAADTITLVLE